MISINIVDETGRVLDTKKVPEDNFARAIAEYERAAHLLNYTVVPLSVT